MTLPHALFKFLSHNRFSHRSRHLSSSAESQHPSIETVIPVHEDGLDSLDRTRNTSVDGLNQGLKLPEEPEINRVDCTWSGSDHLSDEQATSTITSLEAGNLSVRSPRHLKPGHIARETVMVSTSVIYETTIIFPDANTPASTSDSPLPTIVTLPLPTLTSLTPTSPILTSLTMTSSHSTTSSASSSIQCGTGCSMPTTTLQTSAQYSPPTPSSYTAYATPTTPSEATTAPTSNTSATTATTISLQPVLASGTLSPSSSFMISSSLAQSTLAPGTNSEPQLRPHVAAIVGGVIGVVALLALLIFMAIWYRRTKRLSITPFTLPSTARTAQIGSEVRPQSQSIGSAVRPSGRGPPSVQYSNACLVEHSGNRCLSFITSSVSSHSPDDDDNDFASIIVLHRQSDGLEKLYPSPSRARTSDHYCHPSVGNWIDQVVSEDCSRQSSEVLPAYRSTKSLKSGEA